MQTVEELLEDGLAVFLEGVGSTPYEPATETNWKGLFRDKVTWNLAKANQQKSFLLELALWMGINAREQPSLDGWIRVQQLLDSFLAVRVEGYHRNGDKPTIFC